MEQQPLSMLRTLPEPIPNSDGRAAPGSAPNGVLQLQPPAREGTARKLQREGTKPFSGTTLYVFTRLRARLRIIDYSFRKKMQTLCILKQSY